MEQLCDLCLGDTRVAVGEEGGDRTQLRRAPGRQASCRAPFGRASADRQAVDEVEALLAAHGQVEARRLYHSTWTIHDEGKGSVLFTAYGLADVYARPDVRAAAARSDFRPEDLLSGRPATLILVAPESDADRLAPYFTALAAAVVHAAETRAGRGGAPLAPRLGLLLDEAGNMFRFPRLTNLLTTARGNGIQLLLIYHDMAQVEQLYGRTGARTVLSNAKLRMLLPGQGDTETLRYFSTLLGRTLVNRGGLSRNHAGYQSRSTSEQLEELAPVHLLQQIPDGQAVEQYTNLPPMRVRLRMCFRDKALLAASQPEQAPAIVAAS